MDRHACRSNGTVGCSWSSDMCLCGKCCPDAVIDSIAEAILTTSSLSYHDTGRNRQAAGYWNYAFPH